MGSLRAVRSGSRRAGAPRGQLELISLFDHPGARQRPAGAAALSPGGYPAATFLLLSCTC